MEDAMKGFEREGVVVLREGLPGSGVRLHYDYKPYRVVGCFLDWLFCIIPFTDCEPTWLPHR